MKKPKYHEIADSISHLIDIGHYREGSKLPTHRALANEYHTTPVTIAKAYTLLADQGHIESFVGRGSFVKSQSSLKQAIRSQVVANEWNFSILQPCLGEQVESIYHFIQQSFNHVVAPELLGYIEDTGKLEHKEAGLRWMQAFGLQVRSAENILLTNGAQHALSTLIELYSKPGDRIAVESLTYPGILSIIKTLGREAVGVRLDHQGMCPNHLREVCQQHQPALVIVVPSHQNPTAITMPLTRRQAIADVIQKHAIWLLEDDIYGFLNSEVIPPITNLIPEKSFYISSLSKAVSPGLRCGYIKAPQSQLSHLAADIRTMIWLPSPLPFEVATQMINSGAAFDFAEQQKQIAQMRQRKARQILAGETLSENENSYHIWLHLRAGIDPEQFIMTAKERGMLVSEGRFFCAKDEATTQIRLSLMSIPDNAHFEKGLTQLKQLLNQY